MGTIASPPQSNVTFPDEMMPKVQQHLYYHEQIRLCHDLFGLRVFQLELVWPTLPNRNVTKSETIEFNLLQRHAGADILLRFIECFKNPGFERLKTRYPHEH